MKIQDMLVAFNKAWVEQNFDHIVNAVTEDFSFRMADGACNLKGKEDFRQWLNSMQCAGSKATTTVNPPIIDGDGERAVLTGEIHVSGADGEQTYAFCDVYKLHGDKIADLTGYCLKVNS